MGARRAARDAALQMLYLADAAHIEGSDAVNAIWAAVEAPPAVKRFADDLATGTWRERRRIDALIVKYAEHWEMSRMAVIDRNLLRLAAFELLCELETPISVIIDEAIELAKKYSTADSGRFVNGILDKIKTERRAGEPGGGRGGGGVP